MSLKLYIGFLLLVSITTQFFGKNNGLRKNKKPQSQITHRSTRRGVLFNNRNIQHRTLTGDFKTRMGQVIADIHQLHTPQGAHLTNQLTNQLFALYNLLQKQHQTQKTDPSKVQYVDKQIHIEIKKFIKTVKKIQKYLQNHQTDIIDGGNNIALGQKNKISGKQNKLNGSSNVLMGSNNLISGDSAIAKGDRNTVIGNDAFVFGHNNTAKGNNTFIFSFDNKINKNNTLVIGNYAVDLKQYHHQ